jgi:hypothetical protein
MTSTRGEWEGSTGAGALPTNGPDFDLHDAGETTNLLGRAAASDGIPDGTPARDDTWTGDEDFVGLPWWKRPSVCHRLKKDKGLAGKRLT